MPESNPKEDEEGPVTAEEEAETQDAPSEEVGSLLTALLSETRKEVDRERSDVAQQVQDRQDEVRASQEREEARRREELQAQLLEETRKRNEALTRREREGAEQRAEDALLALESAATPASEIDDITPDFAPPDSGPSLKVMGMAAVLILGIGAGVWAMQSSSQETMDLPDIEAEAKKAVTEARLKWEKEEAEKLAAAEAAARKEAEAKAQEAERAQLEAERKALEAERKALDAERKALDGDEEEDDAEASADGDKKKKKRRPKRKKRGLKLKKGLF